MQKVGLVTDSIACLPPEVVSANRIQVVPLNISYEGKVYREGVDLSITQAYRMLAEAPGHWGTSPGSAGEYLEAYRQLSTEFPAVLCVTLSSGLSTLHEMACVAQTQAATEMPATKIEVLDTLSATAGEMLIVLAVTRAASEGKELDEVRAVGEAVKERVVVRGVFETIRHVYRSGRIPKAAAYLVSSLNVKPLFAISGGKIHITGVDTSKQRGVRRLLSNMKEKVGERPVHVGVSHANVPEEGERLLEKIVSEFNCVESVLTDFSPVMGYATGEGVLVIAYYADDDDGE